MHTPGPWTLVEKLSGSENHKGWSLYGTIRPEHGGDGEERCWIADISPVIIDDGNASDDGKGNANLLWAAPDLLAALKAVDEWLLESQYPIDRRDLWNEQFLKAHDLTAAAIAKAEGK